MWLFSFFFLHTPTLFLPNKRFRWGGAGWSLGWDASFRRVKPTVPCPGRKKRKRKKEYKLLMVRTTNSRRRAFPPSGRCSSYCTRSHSAGARSHAHAWLKCCFHRTKKRRKPLGVILYCLFFFFSPIPCLSQITYGVRNPWTCGRLLSSMQKWSDSGSELNGYTGWWVDHIWSLVPVEILEGWSCSLLQKLSDAETGKSKQTF